MHVVALVDSPAIEWPSSTVERGLEQLLLPLLQLLLQLASEEIILCSCFSLPDSMPESVGLSNLRYRCCCPGAPLTGPLGEGRWRTTGVIVRPFCVRCAVAATEATARSSSTDDPELARLRRAAVEVMGHELEDSDMGLFPANVAASRGAEAVALLEWCKFWWCWM